MSYDHSVMTIERDRKKATNLVKEHPTMGKTTTYSIASSKVDDQQHALGQFEPDWSKFESVYAKDLLPYLDDGRSSEEKKLKAPRSDQTRNQVTGSSGGPRPGKDRPHSAAVDKTNRRTAPGSLTVADGRHKNPVNLDYSFLLVSGKGFQKNSPFYGSIYKDVPIPSSPPRNGTLVGTGSERIDVEDEPGKVVSAAGPKSQQKSEEDNRFVLQSSPQTEAQLKTSGFLLAVVDILLDYVRKNNDRSCKVLDFHHPHTLKEMMSHCLDITENPQNLEQILSDCKETLKYCVKTGHPRFFNQLSTGLDIIALAGEWLTATANTNMFTYEIAPVFTLIEDIVLTKMRDIVGWPNGEGDGIFAPGGAISNLYAVAVARHRAVPECKTKGLSGLQRLVMFTSDQSHFSIKRAGAILGIGTDNVIYVQSDERGKMLASDLDLKIEKAKAEGARPFFVSATSGTTVLGAFDPLNDIADVCEKHKLWFHVDGAWGGSMMLSKKYRSRLDGVHRADSVTWNPHKLMGTLLQCSAILIKEKGLLEACNSSNATYLFQQDKHYDVTYDTGDKAIQCGRHNDVFKLWLVWRAKGESGFERQVDKLMDLSRYLLKRVGEREGFELVLQNPEFLNVCFWYIPKNLRHLPLGRERDEKLHKVAPKIKGMMMERGMTMVGYQPLGTRPNFFRMIISNPASMPQDVDFLIAEIEKLGEEI